MNVFIRITILKIISSVFLINLIMPLSAWAALNGNYTINPGAAASSINYQNWASAINDLKLGTRTDGGSANGPGVSGSVTFSVAPGTYTGQIIIPFVTGVSALNTLTFDGVNPSVCILQMNNITGSNHAVVTFDTCKFVTVKNFTITSSVSLAVTNTYGVNFNGTPTFPCMNNLLRNCIINAVFVPYLSYFDQTTYGIYLNGIFRNNTIDGCTIHNGFYGIYAEGTSDSCSGNIIKNNTLINYSSVGISINSSNASKVLNNTLSSNNTSTAFSVNYWLYFNMGIMMNDCKASKTDFTDISGNKITSFWETGIYLYGCNGSSHQRTRVSNNFVSNGDIKSFAFDFAGISVNYNDTVDIWNNSINLTCPGTYIGTGSFYDSGSSKDLDVRNNIFSYAASGLGVPFYSGGKIDRYKAFDYNIFYNADSAKYGIVNHILYTTAAVGGANANSLIVNPDFNSPTNLHLRNHSFGHPGSSGTVTTDIDGETRGMPSLIGADDFPPLANNDIGVTSLTSPVTAISTGLQGVTVLISNSGLNTVTSATIRYSLNGGATVSQTWIGSLAPNDATPFTFTTQGVFFAGKNDLILFSSLPNGIADTYTGNDTLKVEVYSTLNGNYTINPSAARSSSNFVSFTSATTALNGGLVTGPIFIKVSPGIYTEQIELNTVKGVSVINTVRFDGMDTSKVTLTWNGVPGKQHTIRLNGCEHITFARMKITGANPSYAWAVHFASDGTGYNKIISCIVTVPSTVDNMNQCPIVFAGAEGYVPPYITPYVDLKYNRIDSCIILRGKSGIIYMGGSLYYGIDSINGINNNFTNNLISNFNSWGIYQYQSCGNKILNNIIAPNNAKGGGIFCSNAKNSSKGFSDISGNIISRFGFTPYTAEGNIAGGICLYNCNGGSGGNFRVSNNMVGGLLTNSNCIYLNHCSKMDVVYNSLNYNQDFALAPNFAALQCVAGDKSITIKNNILAVTGSGGAASCFFEAIDTVKYSPANFDYNIFYNTANTNLAVVGGKIYSSSNVIGGAGYNVHSQITNPDFVSNDDLHVTTQSNLGIPFPGIATDIDGQTRNSVTPCIGADEINLSCTPPVIAGVISGIDTVCQGRQGVTYTVSPVSGATGYIWSLPAGVTISSGNNTNSITVNYASSAYDGLITVHGTNSCNKGSISKPVVITVNTPPVVTVTPQDASCNGNCNGSAAVTVSGSGGYRYNWSNAATVASVTGLCTGTYQVTVEDTYGCSASQSVSVGAPTALTVSSGKTDATCFNCPNGTATLTPDGGIAPYTYSWSNDETGATIRNLAAGKYYGCVTDAHGCAACDSAEVGTLTAIQPVEAEGTWEVFPNPGSGMVTIKLNNKDTQTRIELFTVTGQRVFDEIFLHTNLQVLDFSRYAKGIYILQITSDKYTSRKKLMIQ